MARDELLDSSADGLPATPHSLRMEVKDPKRDIDPASLLNWVESKEDPSGSDAVKLEADSTPVGSTSGKLKLKDSSKLAMSAGSLGWMIICGDTATSLHIYMGL